MGLRSLSVAVLFTGKSSVDFVMVSNTEAENVAPARSAWYRNYPYTFNVIHHSDVLVQCRV